MNWWVYKNNSTDHTTDRLQGDWHAFFDANHTDEWGHVSDVRALGQIAVGDRILCYQSNRNELVGIARAAYWEDVRGDRRLYLDPLRRLEVRVRPLKEKSRAVRLIKAFVPGPIRTLTSITSAEVAALFHALGFRQVPDCLPDTHMDAVDPEQAGIEGGDRASRARCRDRRLVAKAKQYYGVRCFCCDFDFGEFYGGKADGLCIVHHLEEFRGKRKRRKTQIRDLRVVCANCHLVLHSEQPAMSVDTLRRIVARRRRKAHAR